MDAKLVVVGGDAKAGEYRLALPTVIGRSRNADLTLRHPLISRQHCELFEAEGRLMVRDLGSLNGTFVGDTRVASEAVLKPGALLTIGSVTFRAVYGSAEEMAQGAEELDFQLAEGGDGARRLEDDHTVEAAGLAGLDETGQASPPQVNKNSKSDDGFDLSWLDEDS